MVSKYGLIYIQRNGITSAQPHCSIYFCFDSLAANMVPISGMFCHLVERQWQKVKQLLLALSVLLSLVSNTLVSDNY